MTKDPSPTENSKSNVTTQKSNQNFDNTTITDRLRTVSWSNNSHPTGVEDEAKLSSTILNSYTLDCVY